MFYSDENKSMISELYVAMYLTVHSEWENFLDLFPSFVKRGINKNLHKKKKSKSHH